MVNLLSYHYQLSLLSLQLTCPKYQVLSPPPPPPLFFFWGGGGGGGVDINLTTCSMSIK